MQPSQYDHILRSGRDIGENLLDEGHVVVGLFVRRRESIQDSYGPYPEAPLVASASLIGAIDLRDDGVENELKFYIRLDMSHSVDHDPDINPAVLKVSL